MTSTPQPSASGTGSRSETITVPIGETGSDRHPGASFPAMPVMLTWASDRGVTGTAGHVWLHHGFARRPSHLDAYTAVLVDAGFVVARPHVSSFRRPRTLNDGPYLAGVIAGYDTAVAHGVIDALVEFDVSSLGFVLVGHSAGGAVVVHQAATLARDGAATLTVNGVVLLDANESLSKLMAPVLDELDDIAMLLCSARPHRCNRSAMVSRMLLEHRLQFVGAMFPTGGHCDAEGRADFTCRAMCGGGAPDPADVRALHQLSAAWVDDCARKDIDTQWRPGGAQFDELVASGRITTLDSSPQR